MRYDAEIGIAQMVADYLSAIVDHAVLATCPAVTFYDPMSIDEAHRIVVMVPSVETIPSSPGNFTAHVECVIKSLWAQASIKDDMAAHFERVNEVRDKLMPVDLLDRLAQYKLDGIGLEYVQPRRQFSTSVREGWIVSESAFIIQGYQTTSN